MKKFDTMMKFVGFIVGGAGVLFGGIAIVGSDKPPLTSIIMVVSFLLIIYGIGGFIASMFMRDK